MIGWLWKKLFETEELRAITEARSLQREIDEQRMVQQRKLQLELGISIYDDSQAWLRLHQILKDHEDRIKQLEGK
jgi:hypothetical protein